MYSRPRCVRSTQLEGRISDITYREVVALQRLKIHWSMVSVYDAGSIHPIHPVDQAEDSMQELSCVHPIELVFYYTSMLSGWSLEHVDGVLHGVYRDGLGELRDEVGEDHWVEICGLPPPSEGLSRRRPD